MNSKKKCEHCGNAFESNRLDSKYCSKGCKQNAYRLRNGIDTPTFLSSTTEKVVEQVPSKKEILIKNSTEVALSHVYSEIAEIQNAISVQKQRKNYLIERYSTLETQDVLMKEYTNTGKQIVSWTNSPLLATIYVFSKTFSDSHDTRIRNAKIKARKYIEAVKEVDEVINELEIKKSVFKTNLELIENKLQEQFGKFIDKKEKERGLIKDAVYSKSELPLETIISIDELVNMTFETIKIKEPYRGLIGEPEKKFNMLVWGVAGSGKSTWCLNFANYLANNHGRVLYNSSEEGKSQSLKNKAQRLNDRSQNLGLSFAKNYNDLEDLIGAYDFIFIDSINDMSLTKDEFSKLVDSDKGVVFIGQATKDGKFKGSTIYAHDPDIVLEVNKDNHDIRVEKNRFL